jgi:hypothetical protein
MPAWHERRARLGGGASLHQSPVMTTPAFASVGHDLERVLDASADDLARISDADACAPLSPGKWSRKEVVGHLIDSASNNHQRFVRGTQERGGQYPGYDQDFCVSLQRPNDVPWSVLVGLWMNYNRYLAHVIAALTSESAAYPMRVGTNPERTLLWLATDYVEHLKHHVNQVLGPRFTSTYPNTPPM